MKCLYCSQTDYMYKCGTCKKCFCNNPCSPITHIYHHIVSTKHLNIEMVKCHKCQSNDIFRLYVKNSDILYILCDGCVDGEDGYKQVVFDNRLNVGKEEGGACMENVLKQGITGSRSNVGKEVGDENLNGNKNVYSNGKLSEGGYKKKEMQLKFTEEEYISFFTKLVQLEHQQEKILKESLKQNGIKIEFKKENERLFGTFVIPQRDSRVSVGDELYIVSEVDSGKSGERVSSRAFVHSLSKYSEEIIVEVFSQKVVSFEKFSVEFIVKNVGYDRMTNAIKKIFSKCSKEIVDIIMGNNIEEITNKKINEKCINNFVNNIQDIAKVDKCMNKNEEVLTPPNFPALNQTQLNAVAKALSSPLTLIQGPPGTGKTITTAVITYNLIKRDKGRILVVAPSNTAVENLTEKISKTGLKVVRVVSKSMEGVVEDKECLTLHEQIKRITQNKNPNSSNHTVELQNDHQNSHDRKKMMDLEIKLLKMADVVTCTCVTAGRKPLSFLKFTTVIVDEAVQATEPLTLIGCTMGCQKLVLVGDHKQLGPTILDIEASKLGLRISLFERLIKLNLIPELLAIQYRMHPIMCGSVSSYFYNGMLFNCYSGGGKIISILPLPCFFLCVYGKEEVSESGLSYLNREESVRVGGIVRKLLQCGVQGQEIGVITMYEGQRVLISKMFCNEGEEFSKVEVANVDAYQGREKDYIVFSCVRSNDTNTVGFVGDKRRMNVGLTRAKHGLVIIGNPFTLSGCKHWEWLLKWFVDKRMVYEGAVSDLRRGVLFKKGVFDLRAVSESIDM
ncbi:ATP-dependent helicase [Hamiltosporidium tvaerminnensis]|uniref:ATP-dependent helicase n=3 Tax=Hamiltosporidium TaxID=1176354 RepID=A0A4Q9L0A1_9MICR|nr:ATP-dependent helicase NAM7 [Hamiltosporidium tvaerminnensis]TBU00744.1 ATP-dependent helicase [Hamiltosporidium magnivora]TBU04752.1 ATP-dependent helicase [Hamiltosporidium tvaerminnensis]